MAGSISTETSVDSALHQALKFHNERVSIINEDPSSRTFLFWFIVSCYFPVITACLGPIANTISIACVVERWRSNAIKYVDHGVNGVQAIPVKIADPKGIFAINILSLVFGFISNTVLIMHFTRKLSYLKSQAINITGWSCAGWLLLADVVVCSKYDMPHGFHRTIGFWFACFTSGLYLVCAGTLCVHFIGFRLGKYPATFNLFTNERSIILFTVLLSLWLIWGSAMFSGLLGVSYGNALYFCTVSLLTVGFGDILPPSVAAKIMALIFSVSGVLLLGLIVFMTRSIIQKSSGPIFYFHRLETIRSNTWKKIDNGKLTLTNKESFELMSKYKRSSKLKEHLFSLMVTTIVFLMFWLLGAMVFHYAEGWSYFNCIYFCFLCLLTIGYGSDFAPSTGAGRAFFVVWAIGAVPLMGAILSTLGDVLYDTANKLDSNFAKRFGFAIKYMIVNTAERTVRAERNHVKHHSHHRHHHHHLKTRKLFVTPNAIVDSVDDAQDVDGTPELITDLAYNTDNDTDPPEDDNDTVCSTTGVATTISHPQEQNIHDKGDQQSDEIDESLKFNGSELMANNTSNETDLEAQLDANSRRNSMKTKSSHGNDSRVSDDSIDPLEVVNLLTDKDITQTRDALFYKLEDLQRQLLDLRKLHQLSITNPNYSLSFQQWTNLRILNQHSLNEQNHSTELEESNFWLSANTPLRFPLNEPHYAFNRLFRHIDLQMDRLLHDSRGIIANRDHFTQSYFGLQDEPFLKTVTRRRAFTNQSLPTHWNESTTRTVHPDRTFLRRSLSGKGDDESLATSNSSDSEDFSPESFP
ncbi:similar to Saccharomyces cerevisiae YJL093C TOK1 Outward-rectifier potassium channel of the plasma membrane with two pore domains in tandem [Maudiozyma barnettii]|uniref:Similar to Saccharomyces cerevisiae YJL093C TOK1 Outward-rectifier potassium channel of the plasma membrane with two pore domains in tandem n=1 Tax=Maudiozyma barnettii TaxID=61262 RepID=A0A8H2VK82_9SACH|nr:Tok1p [Kazachstania barnettii]CAB4256956.1 similar to Saccharomyces cerevisiae YJL093C TOK1 Outward-rectifier potassium channel of the plasma membrane with two pore domains in tandem [Kazachstania barnettii]CAD1785561.1 similar to Saccharomyces cerevisiae YJL093C TOK1 Outward-rectifier potassium channel of the plasma membrane with two pore domains in tandem [Kazachstania barnettii]